MPSKDWSQAELESSDIYPTDCEGLFLRGSSIALIPSAHITQCRVVSATTEGLSDVLMSVEHRPPLAASFI